MTTWLVEQKMFSDKAVLGRLDDLTEQLSELDLKVDAIVGVLDELMTPSTVVIPPDAVVGVNAMDAATPQRRKKNRR